MRFGARFLIVGWASTPFVANGKGQRGAPNANQLPTNLIMMKEAMRAKWRGDFIGGGVVHP